MRGLAAGLVLLLAGVLLPAGAQTPQAGGVTLYPPLSPGADAIKCLPDATQGGAILCRARPSTALALNGKAVAKTDEHGIAVIGLTRSQKSPAVITYAAMELPPDLKTSAKPSPARAVITIAKRHDDVGTLEMECEQISPQSPENQKKAEISWEKKEKALKLFNDPLGPVEMAKPVDVADSIYSTSSFGKTRTYIPKTKDCKQDVKIHNGTDIGVGVGTEIRAPMAGTVILADPDLYFEGGCIFLDMGRGLVSVTMHMSRIDVKPGQVVKQGELLGLSGKTGRVTGPHVHWGIKFRNVFEKDRGTDLWLDPMLVMKLDSTKLAAN